MAEAICGKNVFSYISTECFSFLGLIALMRMSAGHEDLGLIMINNIKNSCFISICVYNHNYIKLLVIGNTMRNTYILLKQVEQNIISTEVRDYYRDDYYKIDWDNNVVGLFGERGVGKTTILLQKRLEMKDNSFYFSADSAYIKSHGLFEFVFFCYRNFTIKTIFIDEIFKYSNWKQELKNIIDSIPQLKIIFSGSSSMALYDGVIDLGRRVYDYKINTLSFREYLKLRYNIELSRITFDEIINNHSEISIDYSLKLKDVYFAEYLKMGAYPFGLDLNFNSFANKLLKTLNRVILEDLAYIKNFQTHSLDKLSKLLFFVANSTPSELSINHLSKKIGVDKNLVDNVIYMLSKIGTINLVQKGDKISEKVRKEYKIFLCDTNKYYVYNLENDKGIIREAFFVSEIKKMDNIDISLPSKQDFKITSNKKTFLFEIGGKNKQSKKYSKDTYIIKDDIIISENEHTIPLWLFGFLN
ncbi:MAG: AAA family ATPase [Candidatus Gracilibacteria bacterium]|nr:AAA family ATPase [Candidatus Gracilibacteria bacterium]